MKAGVQDAEFDLKHHEHKRWKMLSTYRENEEGESSCYSHLVCSKECGLPKLRKYSGEKRQLALMEQITRELHGELGSSGPEPSVQLSTVWCIHVRRLPHGKTCGRNRENCQALSWQSAWL